jgi:hypothetical protein
MFAPPGGFELQNPSNPIKAALDGTASSKISAMLVAI